MPPDRTSPTAIPAASTSEGREEDQLVSLVTTPLSGAGAAATGGASASNPPQPPAVLRARRVWVLVLGWAAIIFALSSIPGRAFPAVPALSYDKVLHALVYAVLGGICYLALRATWSARPLRIVLGCTALAIAYGLSDEFHQSFVPGRSPDLHDVVADAVGGLLGSSIAALLVKFRAQRQRTPHS